LNNHCDVIRVIKTSQLIEHKKSQVCQVVLGI